MIQKQRFDPEQRRQYRQVEGTFFNVHTPQPVVAILLLALRQNFRVRIYLGEPTTGLDWNEENDVVGYIGRSTGPIKVPLLLEHRHSDGGPALLDSHIVKITDAKGFYSWQHPQYHSRAFALAPSDTPGFVKQVMRNGEVIARFPKSGQAECWVDFMRGNRFSLLPKYEKDSQKDKPSIPPNLRTYSFTSTH